MKHTLALAAACLAALMFGLEISSVPVILPTLETTLHASFADLQWIMNAYTIACTTVLMGAGTLADRYGRKRVFLCSLVVFGVASLLCGIAESAAILIAARALQGIGGGAMLICLLAILSHQFQDARERSRAFGIWGIVFGTGLGFGPLVGGWIVALSSWPWVFLVHVPLTALTIALVAATVRESRDTAAGRLDLAGIVTLSLAVFALVYFIMDGGWAVLAVAAASAALFVFAERSAAYPMIDMSVFRSRPFTGAILGSVGINFSFWPLMIYLPLHFQNVLGYDSAATGLLLLAYTLPVLLLPPLGERLALRYRAAVIIPVGLFAVGAGLLLLAACSFSGLAMLPGCVLAGAGVGLSNTSISNTATGSVAPGRAGMASGIDISARLITLAINIAVMGVVLQRGFALVAIYGGVGAWSLAASSRLVFGRRA